MAPLQVSAWEGCPLLVPEVASEWVSGSSLVTAALQHGIVLPGVALEPPGATERRPADWPRNARDVRADRLTGINRDRRLFTSAAPVEIERIHRENR
jgi:hypothetical protein